MVAYMCLPGLRQKPKLPIKTVEMPTLIEGIVCSFYGVPIERVLMRTRKGKTSLCRHMIMFMMRKHTRLTLTEIGERYGRRDHTTVIHAVNHIQNMLDTDELIRYHWRCIEDEIFN